MNDEKRLEREQLEVKFSFGFLQNVFDVEFEVFRNENSKRLDELRREKYRKWIEGKNHQAMIENEFRKLQAGEEEMPSEGSSTSSKNSQRTANQRAFHR